MNLHKYILSVVAVSVSVCAFAYPAPQDQDPVSPLMQQYAAQLQALQQDFDEKLLPIFKSVATIALDTQAAEQEDLTPQQEALLLEYSTQLDTVLTACVAPALEGFDLAQFNEQYAQVAKQNNMPAQEWTLEEVTELFKGVYLMSAFGYFEQTQKLTTDELTVLMEIFF